MNSSKCVPMITVADVARTLDWYLSIGFTELARSGEDGEVNFGMVAFGKGEVMLVPSQAFAEPPQETPGSHVSLWFYTDQIDVLYAQFNARRGEIEFVEDLYEPFYGGREFGIRDLNGYALYFLQPAES
jgi:hypothetical protein